MAYTILIRKQAQKTLLSLSRTDRNRITEKIIWLKDDPNNPILDIKPLTGESCYRLRVGKWRVIFSKQEYYAKIIAIEKIKTRGDVYK